MAPTSFNRYVVGESINVSAIPFIKNCSKRILIIMVYFRVNWVAWRKFDMYFEQAIERLNRINWNYTASQNRLIVCNNEHTTSRTALVLMNMQRKDIKPVVCAHIRDTEAFIKMSVRIMEDCVKNSCSCAFATNGGTSIGTASDLILTADRFEGTLRLLAQLENSCNYDFKEFCENINFGIFTDIFIITHYIDEHMLERADKLRLIGINTIFYTTGEFPEDSIKYQFIPITKFSYRWNVEEDNV